MTTLPLMKLATLLFLLVTCNAEVNSGGYLVKSQKIKRRILKSGKNSRASQNTYTNTRSNTVPRSALKGKGTRPTPVSVQTKAPSLIPGTGGAGGGGTPTTSGNAPTPSVDHDEPTGKDIFPC